LGQFDAECGTSESGKNSRVKARTFGWFVFLKIGGRKKRGSEAATAYFENS